MSTLFLFTALFFQVSWAPSLIDNARVIVWENSGTVIATLDTVTVSSTGWVKYFEKGERVTPEKLVVALKPEPVAPLPNRSAFPLALPRPGAKKILENSRVEVWDYRWTPGVPTPMHFHDKDVVVMFLEDGDLKSTTQSGAVTVNPYKAGTIRFNARDRVHTEELVRGTQRAIIIELK